MQRRLDSFAMGKKKPSEVDDMADRAIALRKRLKLTQEQLAERCGLTRVEIAKLETGKNKARSARFLAALARGCGVPQEALDAYLLGELELDDMLFSVEDRKATGVLAPAFGNIEAAIGYHQRRWHRATVAAGRATALTRADDPEPDEWKSILDRTEKALQDAGLIPKIKKAERST